MRSVVWTILLLSLVFLSPALAQNSEPNLTGNWVLNEKMSDDFVEVTKKARGGGTERPAGRGGGGGRGGKGGRRGDRGGTGGDGHEAEAQERMERALEAYSRLEIFHEGIELNVTDGVDITRLLYTDGRDMDIWTQQGEAQATATWQDRTLVVHWMTKQETMSRIRSYNLSSDGRQLVVTEDRRPPGQDQTVKITMVYDLEP